MTTAYKIPPRDWGDDAAEVAPHPAPEVPARPATDDEIPRGARPVLELARGHGWHVVPTYARGTRMGRVLRVVDSLALRMHAANRYAVATWVDGRFTAGVVWGRGVILRPVKLAELREFLAAPEGGVSDG